MNARPFKIIYCNHIMYDTPTPPPLCLHTNYVYENRLLFMHFSALKKLYSAKKHLFFYNNIVFYGVYDYFSSFLKKLINKLYKRAINIYI